MTALAAAVEAYLKEAEQWLETEIVTDSGLAESVGGGMVDDLRTILAEHSPDTMEPLLTLAWRWHLVAMRYADAAPETPEALTGDIYGRLADTLLNTEPVRCAAMAQLGRFEVHL